MKRFWLMELINEFGTSFGRAIQMSEVVPAECAGYGSANEISEAEAKEIWEERADGDVWNQTRFVGSERPSWL